MKQLFIIIFLFISIFGFSQNANFSVHLESVNIPNLGGIQSYAFGQHNGKWLIVGGRLDGLHRRQPFAAFDLAGHNNQLLVVDVENQQKWSGSLSTLPTSIQEQLSATNAEFHQEGDYLYIIGGYGYSATAGDHTTFNYLTAINVPLVINAIINGNSVTPYFRQITDNQFAVTGGRLEKLYDTYYLLGGHKFLGRYNPMGPTHGPGFIQEYTNQIRKFKLTDDGTTINITHLTPYTDTANLHRRDYNVVPQILPNGEKGLTAFSGVFQHNIDLPFLNPVNIDSSGYSVNNNFIQHYNHYHCANFPMYDAVNNEMHTIFFGGIAQFYDDNGLMVQDNDVPFVKTIARVTRSANGTMTEHKLNTEMPTYLGAGSEFIPIASVPKYDNGVVKMDSLTSDTTLVGYIYGGISSSAKNIFWINTGTQSSASSQIFKVYFIKNSTTNTHHFNPQSTSNLKMQIYPNPNNGYFQIEFFLEKVSSVKISIHDINGKLIKEAAVKRAAAGHQVYSEKLQGLVLDSIFFVTLETDNEKVSRKVVIAP